MAESRKNFQKPKKKDTRLDRPFELFRENKIEETLDALKELDTLDANLLKARCYAMQKKPNLATAIFETLKLVAPISDQWKVWLGQAYFDSYQDKFDLAKQDLQNISAYNQRHPKILFAWIDVLTEQEKKSDEDKKIVKEKINELVNLTKNRLSKSSTFKDQVAIHRRIVDQWLAEPKPELISQKKNFSLKLKPNGKITNTNDIKKILNDTPTAQPIPVPVAQPQPQPQPQPLPTLAVVPSNNHLLSSNIHWFFNAASSAARKTINSFNEYYADKFDVYGYRDQMKPKR